MTTTLKSPSPRHPLCYRCEHRAHAWETGHGPRFECMETGKAVEGCYMYRPVAPVVLRRQTGDRRPMNAPVLMAARADGLRIAEVEYRMAARRGEYTVWCEPAAPKRKTKGEVE